MVCVPWIVLVVFYSIVAWATVAPAQGERPLPTETMHIAIINGGDEHVVRPETLALIESALLGQDGVQFVERQEISRILSEQKISLANLVDPLTAVQAGRLFPAEIMLFLEKTELGEVSSVRLTFVETRSGIRLLSRVIPETEILRNISCVAGLAQTVLQKARIPLEQRHYVAILGLQSGEPGHYLDGLAAALRMFLENDLAQGPDVLVLDRDHWQYLRQEAQLTDLDLRIKASTTLLDGRVVRGGDHQFIQEVRLLSSTGQELGEVTVSVPLQEPLLKRHLLAGQIMDKLGAAPAAFIQQDPRAEAGQYARQAEYLLSHKDSKLAAEAAEAALQLDPTARHYGLAIQAWLLRMKEGMYPHPYMITYEMGVRKNIERNNRELPREQKQHSLLAGLRASYLLNQFLSELSSSFDPGHPDPQVMGVLSNLAEKNCALFIPIDKDDRDLTLLRHELQSLQLTNFFAGLSYLRKTGLLSGLLTNAFVMAPYWADHPADFSQFIKRIVTETAASIEFTHTPAITVSCQIMAEDYPERKNQLMWDELRSWLIQQESTPVKMAGYLFRCDALAVDGISAWFKEIDLDTSGSNNYQALNPVFSSCPQLFVPERIDEFCGPLIEYLIQQDDPQRVCQWGAVVDQCVRKYDERCGDARDPRDCQIIAWVDQLRDILKKGIHEKRIVYINWLLNNLERLHVKYARGVFDKKGIPENFDIARMPRRPEFMSKISTQSVFSDDGKFSAARTADGALMICRGKESCRSYQEKDGLPAEDIGSLAWYQGKLFIGFSSMKARFVGGQGSGGGLAVFDPAREKFEIIFSSRANTKRFALDGGLSYAIPSMLVDQERRCLWLGVTMNDLKSGRDRAGLWQYLPDEDILRWAWQAKEIYFPFDKKMCWHDGQIFAESFLSVILFNPNNSEITWLVGENDLNPVYGVNIPGPRAMLADYLVSGHGGNLRFYSREKDESILTKTPDGHDIKSIDDLIMLDDGNVLAIINQEDCWLIKRGIE